jgi:hypothetical protein
MLETTWFEKSIVQIENLLFFVYHLLCAIIFYFFLFLFFYCYKYTETKAGHVLGRYFLIQVAPKY